MMKQLLLLTLVLAFLALHYWDDGKWVEVLTTIEGVQNRAVAAVSHFTTYALLERRHTVYLPLALRW